MTGLTPSPPTTAETPTPQQREPATTIFERSVAGRRAATLPPLDVPERPLDELIPAKLRRERPPELPEVSEPEIVRHYNRLSRRNFDLDTGPYPLGSCTMKHNPRLNERVAALPGPRAPAPRAGPEARPGGAGADVAPGARPGRDLRPRARQPPALGGLPRGAGGPAPHPRLPRRPRRGARQGAGPRHRPRHQPRLGDHGGLRGGQGGDRRARRRRPRRPALQGRRPGRLPDAHQPEHARPVRREHRRDHPDGPRRRRHPVLRRRQPERDHGPHPARRHGVRHRPRQPPQVVLPAARGRRAGGGADRRLGPDRALPARPAPGPHRGRRTAPPPPSTSTTSGRSRSAGCAASRATSASSSAPTPTSAASAATASPRPRRPRC